MKCCGLIDSHDSQFEGDAQQVKADERGSDMNRLQSCDEIGRKCNHNAVTIVQSRKDECDNN